MLRCCLAGLCARADRGMSKTNRNKPSPTGGASHDLVIFFSFFYFFYFYSEVLKTCWSGQNAGCGLVVIGHHMDNKENATIQCYTSKEYYLRKTLNVHFTIQIYLMDVCVILLVCVYI